MTPKQSSLKGWRRWLLIIFGVLILFVCGTLTAMAFIPAPEDPIIPLDQQGGGARQNENSVTGLQAAYPEIPAVDAEQAALGRLLFYDPVLSADDTIACATCHHPDMGFSDGQVTALGLHGQTLRR